VKSKVKSVGPLLLCIVASLVGAVWTLRVVYVYVAKGTPDIYLGSLNANVDVWPSDMQPRSDMFVNCIPGRDGKCGQKPLEKGVKERIGVFRSPGSLGHLMELIVTDLVNKHKGDSQLELISTTPVKPNNLKYSKLIQISIQPILLEATNLALGTVDSEHPRDQITVADVLEIVRLLTNWHCRLTSTAGDYPLLTVTAKRILARPLDVAKAIASFLGLEPPQGKSRSEKSDLFADHAFLLIDECTDFLNSLNAKTYHNRRTNEGLPHSNDLNEMADQVIENELDSGECGSTAREDQRFISTRVTVIVRQFLNDDRELTCEQYPSIGMCKQSDISISR
jgi:hypothetical protein